MATFRLRRAPAYVVYGAEDTCYGPIPSARLDPQAARFWNSEGLGEADDGVACYGPGGIVGWTRFTVIKHHLVLAGTWVRSDMRRQGVALRLWDHILRTRRVKSVEVIIVSPCGADLTRSAKRRWPHIQWHDHYKEQTDAA